MKQTQIHTAVAFDSHKSPMLLHGMHSAPTVLPPRAAVQGSLEKLSDEAVEDTLEKVVRLLAYISDKDLFAEFYRKKLARRLLFNTSASDDHERSILARLKQQCGAQFTSKARPARTACTAGNSTKEGREGCKCRLGYGTFSHVIVGAFSSRISSSSAARTSRPWAPAAPNHYLMLLLEILL